MACLALLATLSPAGDLAAQGSGAGWEVQAGGWVVPLVSRASPAVGGETRTEGYLTQPVLFVHASSPTGSVTMQGMLNLEGATLRRGELNPGVWGEGYIDRRHPHTYLHELVASLRMAGGGESRNAVTVAVGRGFAPFGTDDPMARPLLKFPANHHLAHVLERYVLIAALRRGPALVEAGVFNGNEPTGPTDLKGLRRFGDSWALRFTLLPLAGVEVQGSHARVAAPELPPGTRSQHRKWSGSARYERTENDGDSKYGLIEWARTEEYLRGDRAFVFRSALVEGGLRWRGVGVAARLEETTRPEEERLVDPFRSARPHTDIQLLGITRWRILSARLGLAEVGTTVLRARPFVEVSRAAVRKRLPTQLFDPVTFYGSDRIWNLSLGVRLEAGDSHDRMGRYGAAAGAREEHHH